MTLNTVRSKVPHIHVLQPHDPRLPYFTPFRSTATHFQVTGQFETSALNDPQMTEH